VTANLERMRPQRALAAAATILSLAVPHPTAGELHRWTWPLASGPSAAVHDFDAPDQPWQPGHRGVDLAGNAGDPVQAAGDGVVTYAGLVAGVGVVTVTHGELRTTYQPVLATVRAGEQVVAGQQIGTLAAEGSHCAPSACLHWGLRRGDVYLDPMTLLPTPGRPRLLPLGHGALDPGVVRSPATRHPPVQRPASVSEQAAIGALAGITG
jgi:murein DD-endopeptidase MepM/ murein hydrolase activator NlpD